MTTPKKKNNKKKTGLERSLGFPDRGRETEVGSSVLRMARKVSREKFFGRGPERSGTRMLGDLI